MSETGVEKHIEAVRGELRVHAWGAPRVESAWRDLEAWHQSHRSHGQRAKRIGGAALALAAVFALAFMALRVLGLGTAPSTKAPDVPGLERLALGDGTEVRFQPGARLDVRERTDARVVVSMQAGTAHFRVRHDPRRLFRVEAGGVEVEDLGTTFEVENRGSSVRVSVSEGSVAVSFSDAGGRKRVTLNAGQSGIYASGEPRPDPAAVARPAVDESPLPAASGQAPSDAEVAPAVDWRELARSGKHRRAYELLAPGGFRDVRDDPSDLLLASDVARLSRHPSESAMLLRKLLARHERDPRAPSAAFTLGWVLMNELGRPREAALAFGRAEALAPRGNLAEDAVARSVEAWYRAGELSRAKAEVERYRKSYPQGRHQTMLQRLVGDSVIALLTLLLMAGAPKVAPPPAITIDPCVEVDAEEVRRLAAIELSTWRARTSPGALEVVVSCEGGVQQLKLTDPSRGRVTMRDIDLSAAGAGDRDAKTRELALAIAELLRRAETESPPETPAPPTAPAPVPRAPPKPPATTLHEPVPWTVELGVSAGVVGWTGGEVLFAADLPGRIRVARWLIAELRFGGRKTRRIDLENGTMDGSGVAAAAGFSLDATPGMKRVGVSFGARLGADLLQYVAVDRGGSELGGADAVAVHAAGTTTAFVALSGPICLTLDAAVGGALHSVVIQESERSVSGVSGVLLSSAVGLAAHF